MKFTRPHTALTLLACLITPWAGAGGTLTREESDLAAWIVGHATEAEALLAETVNINSGTLNPAGVRRVGERLGREFAAIGFETEWVEQPAAMQRGGHLIARHTGDRGRKILLIGHLDTVYEADDSFQAYSAEGDIARGPGVYDMKSGNVILLHALRGLAAQGLLEGLQVTVVLTGDEESPGEPLAESRRHLIEAGRWAEVALGFESGVQEDGEEWATVARRSSSDWVLEVTGRQAHSAGIFNDSTGAGAIFEASRILNGFYDEVRGERYLTFNAGTILGGTEVSYDPAGSRGTAYGKTNVVPSKVLVHGGLRTISEDQTQRAREAMRRVVERHLPHTDATVSFNDSYPAMAPTAGNERLRVMLSDINVALGRKPMPAFDPARRGAADISFVAPYTDALAGLGGYGQGAHSPDEQFYLSSLPVAAQRAAILIHRLGAQ